MYRKLGGVVVVVPLACKVQNLLIADFLNYLALRHGIYLSTLSEVLDRKSVV